MTKKLALAGDSGLPPGYVRAEKECPFCGVPVVAVIPEGWESSWRKMACNVCAARIEKDIVK